MTIVVTYVTTDIMLAPARIRKQVRAAMDHQILLLFGIYVKMLSKHPQILSYFFSSHNIFVSAGAKPTPSVLHDYAYSSLEFGILSPQSSFLAISHGFHTTSLRELQLHFSGKEVINANMAKNHFTSFGLVRKYLRNLKIGILMSSSKIASLQKLYQIDKRQH